jgi:hypothetical protein
MCVIFPVGLKPIFIVIKDTMFQTHLTSFHLPPAQFANLVRHECDILDISQPYRPQRPVTRIALLYGDGVCFL